MTRDCHPECEVSTAKMVALAIVLGLITGLAGWVCRGRECELREAEILRLGKGVRQ